MESTHRGNELSPTKGMCSISIFRWRFPLRCQWNPKRRALGAISFCLVESGQERFYQCRPLCLERRPAEAASSALVPVVGVRGGAFLAMKVGMHGHAVWGLQLIDQGMSLGPITLRIPPQRREENR